MEFLFGVGLFLFVVSIIGHLFWVFMGWLWDLFTQHSCEECGSRRVRKLVCEKCSTANQKIAKSSIPSPAVGGAQVHISSKSSTSNVKPSLASDLAAARRLVQHAKVTGLLDSETLASFAASLERLEQPAVISSAGTTASTGTKEAAISLAEIPGVPTIAASTEGKGGTDRELVVSREVLSVVDNQRHKEPVKSVKSLEVHPLDEVEESEKGSRKVNSGRQPVERMQRGASQWIAEMISAFMERSNIRWMELMAASLVVVCSVGLVISLWSTLAATSRFFPSLVFMLATVGVHGAGQYTLKKWKLQNTSRGILHIALMLIPLAVMIGILLARGNSAGVSQGPISMDWQYWTMLITGIGVYGGLAVTAAQSLFVRAWLPVAIMTIVGSLSLVGISWGARTGLGGELAEKIAQVWILVPALASSGVLSWFQSYRGVMRTRRTFGFYRRQIGIAIQLLFASIAVFVFWSLHFGSLVKAGPWVWAIVGIFASFWVQWGVIHSDLTRRVSESFRRGKLGDDQELPPRGDTSSAIVLSWLIGLCAAVVFAWGVWLLAENRVPLLVLLGVAGVSQSFLGWRTENARALALGVFTCVLAATFGIEVLGLSDSAMRWSDWFSWQRVLTLTVLGGATLGAGIGLSKYGRGGAVGSGAKRLGFGGLVKGQFAQEVHDGWSGIAIGGAAALGLGMLLSVFATLVPWGRTPYGGDWAGALVTLYGLALILWMMVREIQSGKVVLGWMVMGQLVGMLGIYRVFTQGTWLPTFIAQWRNGSGFAFFLPNVALGFGCLALFWVVLAIFVRWCFAKERSTAGIVWLLRSAIALSLPTWLVCGLEWESENYFRATGWIFPTVCMGGWIAMVVSTLRWSEIIKSTSDMDGERELGWGLLVFWLASCLHSMSRSAGLIPDLSSVGTQAWYMAAGCGICYLGMQGVRRLVKVPGLDGIWRPVSYSAGHVWHDLSIVGMTVTTLVVAFRVLVSSMVWDGALKGLGGITKTINGGDTGFLVLGVLALGSVSLLAKELSRENKSSTIEGGDRSGLIGFVIWLGMWILGTEGVIVLQGAGALSVDIHPWVVSSWMMAILALGYAWMEGCIKRPSLVLWLPIGSVLLLVMGACKVFLSEDLSSSIATPWQDAWSELPLWSRLFVVSQWFVPGVVATFGAWLVSVVTWRNSDDLEKVGEGSVQRGESGGWMQFGLRINSAWDVLSVVIRGTLLALTISLLLTTLPRSWGGIPVESFMRWLSAPAFGFGLVSLGTSWEFLADRLRRRGDHGSTVSVTRLVANPAAREASWHLGAIGLGFGVLVSLLACAININHAGSMVTQPTNVPYWTLIGLGVSICAALITGIRTERNSMALIMMLIAVLAPVVPLIFSEFLLHGWGTVTVNQLKFRAEMLHAMLLGWIVALAFGVKHSRSNTESLFWSGLASVTMFLSMWHPSGTPVFWVLGLGLSVSLLVLMRGLFRERVWIGHLAAFLSAAVIAWFSMRSETHIIGRSMFWGPMLCAIISLAWYRLVRREERTDSPDGSDVVLRRWVGWSVDQTVSWQLPMVLLVWTGIEVAGSLIIDAFRPGLSATFSDGGQIWSMVALALVIFGLAVGRCWDSRSGWRGWAVYLSVLNLATLVSTQVGAQMGMGASVVFLSFLYGALIAMIVLAVCLREWLRESQNLLPVLKLGALAPKQADFVSAGRWLAGAHSGFGLLILGVAPILVLSGFNVLTVRLSMLLPILSALSILPLATDLKFRSPRVVSLLLLFVGVILLSWSDLLWFESSEGQRLASGNNNLKIIGILERTLIAVTGLCVGARAIRHRVRGWLDWDVLLERSNVGLVVIGTALGWIYLLGAWGLRGSIHANWISSDSLLISSLLIASWVCLAYEWIRSMIADDVPSRGKHLSLVMAELCLLGAVLTLRLFHPWIFTGWVKQWWPVVTYALAFGSIGIGEWLRRRGKLAIADPLQRQSLLLPLIPLIAAWVPRWNMLGDFWGQPMSFSLLLLVSGVAYMVLGAHHRWTLLKTLALGLFLSAFWSLLHSQEGWRFLDHPQLWLIPPAIATLVFVERNQGQLAGSVVSGVRYLALLLIYMSSSMEMLFKSFELQFWSPVVLLAFAIAGMIAGVVLRVRAFLFCGSGFVFVALFGMVWQAQRAIGQVWPWWAFGICMGVGLIVLIGYFEKNRARFLEMIQSLRTWQP